MLLSPVAEFQVQLAGFKDVHLGHRSCTCHKLEVLGIPCSQALAAMRMTNLNPYDFYDNCYLTMVYQVIYNEVLHVTRDSKQCEHGSY